MAGIFWSLEPGQAFLQGPDFFGMEACTISHCGDRETFLAFGNAKGLLAEFSDLGDVKKIYGRREKCPGISSGIANPW
jgi:hypothetical protein